MHLSRRTILTTGAATAIIVGGAGYWGSTRYAKEARAPWREASAGFGDPRLDVLAYAILAPNPHNMQPWLIRLEDDLTMSVFCDLDRRLPQTDPYDRQIVMGFGCFLELLRQAASEKGYRAEITLFPEGEPQPRLDQRPLAAVTLVRDSAVKRDALFNGVLGRRTNRLAFDTTRSVAEDALAPLIEATVPGVRAFGTTNETQIEKLRHLTREAWVTEWSTARTRHESIVVTRIGKAEISANPHGLVLEGPMMEALGAAGFVTRDAMDQPGSRAYEEGLAFYTRAVETAMAYVWTITDTNTRQDQIEAGRSMVRMQLAANAAGLAFHPLSQALQEYPEMAAHYQNAHNILGADNGQTVQILCRVGYGGGDIPPAPRWPLESRLLRA